MELEDQIIDLELYLDHRPRVYIKWKNTEEGRDKTDCFERIVIGGNIVVYVNANNRMHSVFSGTPFFERLEKLYQNASADHENKIQEAEIEVKIPVLEGLHYTISFKKFVGPEFVIWTHEKGNPNRKVKEFLAMPKELGKAITEYVQDCINGH
jgi:hypothetical protein